MPKPKKNESKQGFLNRCTRELIDQEGREPDQAYAICNSYWNESAGDRSSISLAGLPMEFAKNEDKKRSFILTAYTGQKIARWYNNLIIDVAGMTAKASIPILREHMRDRVAGHSTKSWKDDSNFFLSGDLSESTRDGREVASLADEGFPWQASVGIWARKIEVLEDEKTTAEVNGQTVKGPLDIWRESLVGEVSFVALGADDQTAAIVLTRDGKENNEYLDGPEWVVAGGQQNQKEDTKMTLDELKAQYPELVKQIEQTAAEQALEAGRKEGTENERARVIGILDAAADPETSAEAIRAGTSIEASYKLFYESEKKKRAAALVDLEESAPDPVGTETPPAEQETDPDKELALKAREIAREDNISIAAALRKAAAQNPGLASAALPKVHIVK